VRDDYPIAGRLERAHPQFHERGLIVHDQHHR
jgi:hypothetical protein